nr:vesicle-associated protein 4-2-like [Ipomoea batatas]
MNIKSFLPTRRRLSLDPSNKLYFSYEPGKQVKSAIRIKNVTKAHVAFKFQTTAPKSCYMRPPGGILAPDESLIATGVFKFVEPPENNERLVGKKSRVKFKIMSLKVKGDMDYVPELAKEKGKLLYGLYIALQFDEQKDEVAVEQILRVVFLDVERPCAALEKLNRQLAEAEAELEARKKPPEDNGPKIVGEGLVIDEWSRICVETLPNSEQFTQRSGELQKFLSTISALDITTIVWMAATVAVVNNQSGLGQRWKSVDSPPLSGVPDGFTGSGTQDERRRADDSLRQVMFLNCWGQS